MIANVEYWYSKHVDEAHVTKGDLDVYTSALNLNGVLYSVIIKLNIPPEEMGKSPEEKLKDYYYKDHSLVEIEIAPALYDGLYTQKGGANQQAARAATEAISKISLGILRGRVKPSLIENSVLYDIGKFGETKGGMSALLDGCRMIVLFENHDVSTILHEMAHFWLEELRDAQNFSTCPVWARELWADLEDAYGFDREAVSKRQWVMIQERFALEFERYCKAGKAPNQTFQPAFDRFKEWISDICDRFMNNGKNDKIRAASKRIFDVILGGEKDEPKKPAYKPMRM